MSSKKKLSRTVSFYFSLILFCLSSTIYELYFSQDVLIYNILTEKKTLIYKNDDKFLEDEGYIKRDEWENKKFYMFGIWNVAEQNVIWLFIYMCFVSFHSFSLNKISKEKSFSILFS